MHGFGNGRVNTSSRDRRGIDGPPGRRPCTAAADAVADAKYVVGYCTDALADLLCGPGGMYRPDPVERISFDLEPVEIRWVLRGTGAGVDVSIYRFPDISESFGAPDADGTVSWRSTQPRSRLVHAVVGAAQKVLQEHGEAGYEARWVRFPFPVSTLQDLLRTSTPRPAV
ncbi:hypothetical protein OHV13_34370 [Kitasatospora purpeofusca]|uniref:hypothetical protein n=1 Tax=Kitasatospora purpeofusca TaxID=67352 RepID=UPI003254A594